MKYVIQYQEDGKTPASIFEPSIGNIPIDEENSDYREYLTWLEENK